MHEVAVVFPNLQIKKLEPKEINNSPKVTQPVSVGVCTGTHIMVA